jgi:RNA polymerase sigma-70 factor (ECF subfamily)
MPVRDQTMTDVEALYRALREPLRRFLLRRVRDPEIADDLLHDVFLRVQARRDTLDDVERIESWIYTIARNAVVDRQRRARLMQRLDFDLAAPEPGHGETPLQLLATSARECIDYLPQPYRDALHATAIEGLSQRALAERCGLSLSGAKSRVQRARRILAALYRECCDLEFDARGALVGYTPRVACDAANVPMCDQRVKNDTPANAPMRKASLSKP